MQIRFPRWKTFIALCCLFDYYYLITLNKYLFLLLSFSPWVNNVSKGKGKVEPITDHEGPDVE
jgi:hypothetical protein